MAVEMALELVLGLREEAHAPAIAREPGDEAETERARVPQRIEQARARVEVFEPVAAPREVVTLLGGGALQRVPHLGIARDERLAAIERLGADLARVVHAHEARGAALFFRRGRPCTLAARRGPGRRDRPRERLQCFIGCREELVDERHRGPKWKSLAAK